MADSVALPHVGDKEDARQPLALKDLLVKLDDLTNWEQRPRTDMRISLDPMRDLMQRLRSPQNSFRAVHVTGTKGKGSVSTLVEFGLASAGLSVGRYGSPHLEHVSERFSINGSRPDEGSLALALRKAIKAYEESVRDESSGANASWFDVMTAAAFVLFRSAGVSWAIVEVGLGGRLDSTNVIDGEVAVITNVGLEHTEVLGESLGAIAREKAGIVKQGATLVTPLRRESEAGKEAWAIAESRSCRVITVPSFDSIELMNAAMAEAVLGELGRRGVRAVAGEAKAVGPWLLDDTVKFRAKLPGRMERVEVPIDAQAVVSVVLDGAHVPFNLEAVLSDLNRSEDLAGPCVAVLAMGQDKKAADFVSVLSSRANNVICTSLFGGRGCSPLALHHIAVETGMSSEALANPIEAFERAARIATNLNGWVLVTGSLHLVGSIRSFLIERRPKLGAALSVLHEEEWKRLRRHADRT